MPDIQARAYDAVLQMVGSKPGDTLAALQNLRSVSLHPQLVVPGGPADHASFVSASARLKALERILDGVAARGEKVLVFVDIIEAQRALAVLLAERYRLKRPPAVINGSTSSEVRDKIRREFQSRPPGFDVLLLGPKAAGFGLTLTAANHVVHLNRWWNPAVEDQCSDRVYRIGQEREVTVWLPQAVHPRLGDKSYDVLLNHLLEEKRELSREIVVPTQMTERDFRRLYEQVTGRGGGGADALDEVDGLDWRSFEKWVAHRLREAGFSVDETPRTGDGGADLLGRGRRGAACIIQCKHRARGEDRFVDESAVHEVAAAAARYAAYRGARLVAATNGTFELAAQRLASERGVVLVDRATLSDIGSLVAAT